MQSITHITVHNTDNYNDTASAKNHADWLFEGSPDKTAPMGRGCDLAGLIRNFARVIASL